METDFLPMAWTQLWQVTLLVLAVAVLVLLVARNRPHLACALWLVVLVKCVTPPLFASPSGVFCWLQPWRVADTSRCPVDVGPSPGESVETSSVGPLPQAQKRPVASAAAAASDKAETSTSWSRQLPPLLLATWFLGTAVSLGTSIRRWRGCLRRASREGLSPSEEVGQWIRSLARRLGVRKPIRVVLTRGRLGPAVTGVLRPTLLLPEGIVRKGNRREIEPLLVHELIHIRRGDLWAGLLQTLVLALWWFHPLVRWAVRRAITEAERCCDEAVVAELGCEPKDYARGLLDVLQYKTDWVPAPAFPGAGRVEATSTRLERIMRLGQGCRRRSPWWCWAVMVGTAAVVLPGRTFIVSGGEIGNRYPILAASDPARPENVQGPSSEPLEVHVTFLSGPRKVIESMDIEWTCLLSDEVDEGYQPPPEEFLDTLAAKLRANPTPSTEELMAAAANQQTAILPGGRDRSAGNEQVPLPTRVHHVVGKHTPMRYSLLDEQEAALLVEQSQQEARVNLVQGPRVFLQNGQTACVSDTSQSPFVVNVKPVTSEDATALEPVIRIVEDGTKLQVRPTMQKDGYVQLDYQFCMTTIQEVDTCTFKVAGMEGPATVQVPVVETMQVNASNVLKPGSTLVIAGMERSQSEAETVRPRESVVTRLAKDLLGIGGIEDRPRGTVSQLLLLRVQKASPDLSKNGAGTGQAGDGG